MAPSQSQSPNIRLRPEGSSDLLKAEVSGNAFTTQATPNQKIIVNSTNKKSFKSQKDFPIIFYVVAGQPDDAFSLSANPTALRQMNVRVTIPNFNVDTTLAMNVYGQEAGVALQRQKNAITGQLEYQVTTLADYHQQYFDSVSGLLKPDERPKLFSLGDNFMGTADTNIATWTNAMKFFAGMGYTSTAINAPNEEGDHKNEKARVAIARQQGITTFQGGYSAFLPGGPLPFGWAAGNMSFDRVKVTAAEKVRGVLSKYKEIGISPEQISSIKVQEEPNFNEPIFYYWLSRNRDASQRFHAYLQNNGVTLYDTGKPTWDEVVPVSYSEAKNGMPGLKKVYYLTQLFMQQEAANWMGYSAEQFSQQAGRTIPIFMNVFGGRNGVFHTNGDKPLNPKDIQNFLDRDAHKDELTPEVATRIKQAFSVNVMDESYDWSLYARGVGVNTLWTEDWFPDNDYRSWYFMAERMRSATTKPDSNATSFGSYVMTASARMSGGGLDSQSMKRRALALIGSGAKNLIYYYTGPEYAFSPYTVWGAGKEKFSKVMTNVAETNRMIAKMEDVLYPGKKQHAQVAILMPRSSQYWDDELSVEAAKSQERSLQYDWAQFNYQSEVSLLFFALQNRDIPVDFVDEQDLLNSKSMSRYKVLYITEPNIPRDSQTAIGAWVQNGGSLMRELSAGSLDEYNEPCSILNLLTGLRVESKDRDFQWNITGSAKNLGTIAVTGNNGMFIAVGRRGSFGPLPKGSNIYASFAGGAPAIVSCAAGRGEVFQTATLLAQDYYYPISQKSDKYIHNAIGDEMASRYLKLPIFEESLAKPVRLRVGDLPVQGVDASLLESDKGLAIILDNTQASARKFENVAVLVRRSFPVKSITSYERGHLSFKQTPEGLEFTLPLIGSKPDVIAIR